MRSKPIHLHGRTLLPLTEQPGGMQAYKMLIPPGEPVGEQKSHEGYEWMYVLAGQLRLKLGELDLVLSSGEVAEFDTHTPHWFGSAGPEPRRASRPVRSAGRADARPGAAAYAIGRGVPALARRR